ncbi:hypothetical protein Q9233_005812, partial [Columba guinea]
MEVLALERFRSPGKGSGLRACRRVRPGELLYRAEPFAYVVTKERLGGVCERCLRRFKAVKCEALQECEDGINKLPLEEEGGVTNTSFLALRKDGEGGMNICTDALSAKLLNTAVNLVSLDNQYACLRDFTLFLIFRQ